MAQVQDAPTRTDSVAFGFLVLATACGLLAFGGLLGTWAVADAETVGNDLVGTFLGAPAALGMMIAGMGFLGRKEHPRTALALGIVATILTILPAALVLAAIPY